MTDINSIMRAATMLNHAGNILMLLADRFDRDRDTMPGDSELVESLKREASEMYGARRALLGGEAGR